MLAFNIVIVVAVVAYTLGVFTAQDFKDWLKGVPADVRTGLDKVEADVLAHVKLAHKSVVPAVAPTSPPVMPPVTPAA